MVSTGVLTEDNFRVGETKIFFKAGVLAHLEDVRDEALKLIMTKLQAWIRAYVGLIDCKRRREQKAATLVLQRNIRTWVELRKWNWFKLYAKVKPMCREGKVAEQMEKLTEKLKSLEEALNKETKAKQDVLDSSSKTDAERADLLAQLEETRNKLSDVERRVQEEAAKKGDVDNELEVHFNLFHFDN